MFKKCESWILRQNWDFHGSQQIWVIIKLLHKSIMEATLQEKSSRNLAFVSLPTPWPGENGSYSPHIISYKQHASFVTSSLNKIGNWIIFKITKFIKPIWPVYAVISELIPIRSACKKRIFRDLALCIYISWSVACKFQFHWYVAGFGWDSDPAISIRMQILHHFPADALKECHQWMTHFDMKYQHQLSHPKSSNIKQMESYQLDSIKYTEEEPGWCSCF